MDEITKDDLRSFLRQYTKLKWARRLAISRIMEAEDGIFPHVGLDGMPHGTSPSEGAAAAALRIEASHDQLDRIDEKFREIEAVIDTLPPESTEHSVIGYRFLQNHTWDYIAARIPYSSRRLEDYEYMGLDTLLAKEHVRAAVRKFKEQGKRKMDKCHLLPLGDRIVVRLDPAEEQTAGGLYISKATQEAPQTGTIERLGEVKSDMLQ